MIPFSKVLESLPDCADIDRIELRDGGGIAVAVIENKPGQSGSVRVYRTLLDRHGGRIDGAAAVEGLALYAEHTDDARRQPGRHPNIDRLLAVAAGAEGFGAVIRRRPG